ncbi:MAG: tyrosine--tRNA ligase [Bacteroidota bacterium]
MKSLTDTLRSRNMLHDLIPGTPQLLQTTPTSAYIGIDPTASSLHIGHLTTLMLLKHLQLAGHKPIIVLGGATAMIGDPSFKSQERKLLDKHTVEYNQHAIQKQIDHLFPQQGNNAIQVLNNHTWYATHDFLSFLRDVGKHITMNYMLAKEAIKNRLQTGISYTEFTYPLLQAYDFYHLYQHHGVRLQIGGSDQWGNITTGTEFIRKKIGKQAFGFTTPLVTKADGTKFGKTEKGNIWLDAQLTTPYEFYQFWLNCSDQETPNLMKKLTLLDLATIQNLVESHQQAPAKRLLQKQLAQTMTTMVHSHQSYLQAKLASEILFSPHAIDPNSLAAPDFLIALQDLPKLRIPQNQITENTSLVDLLCTLTQGKIFTSKRAAREMIQAGGVRINKIQIKNPATIPHHLWLWEKYMLIQKGKKNYFLIQAI